MTLHSTTRRAIARPIWLASLATVLITATACSSSGSGEPSPTAHGSASEQTAAAQAATAKALELPTTIPLTTPLNSKPPTGETFVFLQCELAQCKTFTEGVQAATDALGWALKVLSFENANPATLTSAMEQALQYDPVGVAFTGFPKALWQSEIPAYKAAGVPLIPAYAGPIELDSTVISDIGAVVEPVYASFLSNWIIADSNAKAKILSFRVDDFAPLKQFSDAFATDTASNCSDCSVVDLKATIPQVTSGASTSAVISALQKDPSIKYVVTCNAPFFDALPGALKAAGLYGKVKVLGRGATSVEEKGLETGDFAALTSSAQRYTGWLMVDVAARHMQGLPIAPSDGGEPVQLLTPDSLLAPADSYDYPADYPEQLKKLWHVG